MIPKVLKAFNLFVDGRGYAGRVDEITLPKLTLKTEEHRAGGMDMPVEIDMGMEKLECDFTLAEYDTDVLKLFGLSEGNLVALTLRGAMEKPDGGAMPVVVNLRGIWREVDYGGWKAGEKTVLKVTVAARYYKMTIDGEEIHAIDAETMERRIAGKDRLAELRAAIGL